MTLIKTAEGVSSSGPTPGGWWTGLYGARTDGAGTRDTRHGLVLLVIILAGLTGLRIAALFVSPSELGFDEAQYWDWSRHFAFGYFTKPPLIAWIIGIERGLCGDTAACVRLASPLFHLIESHMQLLLHIAQSLPQRGSQFRGYGGGFST